MRTDADARAISEHIQDAIDDGVVTEDRAARIRQVLTTPRLRLEAELGALLDVDRRLADRLVATLRRPHAAVDLEEFLPGLHSLPRSNLLAHLAARFGSERRRVSDLLDAQQACAPGSILDAVNDERERASLPPADRPALETALESLFRRQMQGAVEGVADHDRRASVMVGLIEHALSKSDRIPERLDDAVEIYAQSVAGELSRREEAIGARIQSVRGGARTDADLVRLRNAVAHWMTLVRPMQMLDGRKGRDEPRTRDVYERFNALGISLANDESDAERALRLLEIARETFDALPGAAEQIEDNIRIVRGNLAFQRLGPLRSGIEDAENDVRALDRDLRKFGFADARKGRAAALFKLFADAVEATKGSEAAGEPWHLVRNLAIQLTNEHKFPLSSEALLRGMLRHAEASAPPGDVHERMTGDLATVTDNLAFESITGKMSRGRLKGALAEVVAAREATRRADNRHAFGELETVIRRRRFWQRTKRWAFGAVAVFVGIVILDEWSVSQSRRPATTNAPAASSPDTTAGRSGARAPTATSAPAPRTDTETRPAANSSSPLTRAELRWCRFQDVRLQTAMEGEATMTNAMIGRLNVFIDEWNGLCDGRRYRDVDWSAIGPELSSRRATLESEGRNLLR